jgi:hypothetical protein
MTPSVQLFIAQELQSLRRPFEAYTHGVACGRAAEADPALHNRDRILTECRDVVSAVEPELARLALRVSAPPGGLTVRVAGAEVPRASWGEAIPLAPGTVSVEARAVGFDPFHREIRLVAGRREELVIELTPSPRAPSPPAVTPHARTVAPRRASVAPWLVVGAGAASLALAGVFFGLSASEGAARDEAFRACACHDNTVLSAHAAHERWFYAGHAALWTGVAAVGGGLAWWLVTRGEAPPRAAVALAPIARGWALTASGSF